MTAGGDLEQAFVASRHDKEDVGNQGRSRHTDRGPYQNAYTSGDPVAVGPVTRMTYDHKLRVSHAPEPAFDVGTPCSIPEGRPVP